MNPRTRRLRWSDRHMLEALLSAGRSPDPNTQVGACIVNNRNRIVASGYNSFPNGISTHMFSWTREHKDKLETKYPYVVHAEKNAIYNATGSVESCTLYATMYPCNECAKDIIQAGIKKVVYLDDPYHDAWFTEAARRLFECLDITVHQHQWSDDTALSYLRELCQKIES